MQSLTSLPTEILHKIIRFAEPESLKTLRQVCRSLGEIGKERLFESITVYAKEESCDKFTDFLENEDRDCLHLVTKVYLDLSAFEYDGYRVYNHGIWEGPREKTFRRFVRLFPRLKELPRLRSIVLGFYPESPGGVDGVLDVPYTLGIRSAAIKEFLSAITTLPQVPQELAFRELLNVNESNQDEVEKIEKVLQNLRSLRLNITNPHNWGDHDDMHTFFSTLPSFWLKPALQILEHLTMYSNVYFELYLDDCTILWAVAPSNKERTYLGEDSYTTHPNLVGRGYATYDTRWHHYFQSFHELRHLRHFRYGRSEYWRGNTIPFERETEIIIGMHEESYLTFSDSYAQELSYDYGAWLRIKWEEGGPLPWIEEDQTSLEERLAKIGQRYVIDEATEHQIALARELRRPRAAVTPIDE
ncbi:hypothetical protein AO1008_01882 [Aspergillus oryzae 100-8]|uniref:F-box domain-containing protein n=1 Tax=Aspergillus oryzae (strain 3.042) TaxID=1160506 RepID=I8A3P7_ASPO3|nr:hypothetical protein Ao3042_03989 [Aspergillus oryzae 3.042]KDE76043.1 hypothetical protein AO1008_01882 [Aspergillus oryzae 100-8]|eukprot:EIT79557.1 hypothetical protein Ao3042_03989 [Aspergillus oryzae 3.042]